LAQEKLAARRLPHSPATSAEQFIAQYRLAIVVSAEGQPNEGR
jgi:hypothetical protein